MTWHQRYLVRTYIGTSLWIWPAMAIIVALVAAQVIHAVEPGQDLGSAVHPEAARSVLNTLAASMFTCIVFAGSALLLAVQLASAQLTPRMIALVFKNRATKLALSVFVFAFTFTLAVLVRIGEVASLRTTQLAAYSCLISLGLFVFLIDHVGRFLRPSGVVLAVAQAGHQIIDRVYPRYLSTSPAARPPDLPLGEEPTYTVTSENRGVILAVDTAGIVALGRRFDCAIVMLPQVGDFVASGEPLFRVYGGGKGLPVHALSQSISVGQERTFDQDPALALRIIVDVASKALSPAINDPTTAVLAIDQIHHLLRHVGNRHLDEGEVRDPDGRLRFLYRTPDWEDFVRLAVTEIRQYGAQSIQVNRRLRAMLENLLQAVPRERAKVVQEELALLHRTVKRAYPDPEDQAMAEVSDPQGVGGAAEDDGKGADGGVSHSQEARP